MSDLNPYQYKCKKHGNGWASIDECPKCMEQSYLEEQSHEFDWIPKLCGGCRKFDLDGKCYVYPSLPVEYFARSKKCKHYIPLYHCPNCKKSTDVLWVFDEYDSYEREFCFTCGWPNIPVGSSVWFKWILKKISKMRNHATSKYNNSAYSGLKQQRISIKHIKHFKELSFMYLDFLKIKFKQKDGNMMEKIQNEERMYLCHRF